MKTRLFNISYRVPDVVDGISPERFFDMATNKTLRKKEKIILAKEPEATLYIYEIAVPTVPLVKEYVCEAK